MAPFIAPRMRAWCAVVPIEKGEEVRRALRDRGVLLKHLRIRREENHLLMPISGPVDLPFAMREIEIEAGFAPVRSYKDLARLPDRLRPLLPTSFDVIGDIAVLKIPEELEPHRPEIGRAVLAWSPKVKVVAQDRGVTGARRIRRVEVIGGEDRTTTVHTEYGLHYRVDVARAYFSPRLGTERKKIADLVGAGETVLDPFAGVGPYAILIAKRSAAKRVVASDSNPDAVAMLRDNVAMNRADRVEVREGDARAILRAAGPVDRVLLDLPHSSMAFISDALRALGPRGTVHLYAILEQADREHRGKELRYHVEREGRRVVEIRLRTVRAYSPTQHHVAYDVTVAPG